METESSVIERWFFYQDTGGLWKWARLDIVGTILDHSGSSFDSRAACVDNARQSGYDEERRPELGLTVPHDWPPGSARLAREKYI